MLNTQTRLIKSGELIDVNRREAGDSERPVSFRFSVTWAFLFGCEPAPVSASSEAARSDRVYTLGGTSDASLDTESSALAAPAALSQPQCLEPPPDDWPKPAASSEVTWEMVVPRMVRPASKSSLAEQVVPRSHRLAQAEDLETAGELRAAAPVLAARMKRLSRAQMIQIAIGLAITLIGLMALLLVHHWMPRSKPAEPAQPVTSSLKLEAEPQGNGMINIKWNAASAPVAKAREGRLVIVERDQQPEMISLGPDQLKIGHLSYGSTAESLGLRLEVVDRSGATAQESVSLNSPRTAPAAPASSGSPATAKDQPPISEVSSVLAAKSRSDSAQKGESATAQPSRAPTREFKPPSGPGRAVNDPGERNEAGPALPELSSNAPSVTAIPSAIRLLEPVGRIPAPQVPVKETPAARPPESPAARALKVGGDLQAGKLVKKVMPVYPAMASSARVQGMVRFAAVIGKDGKIQNLKVLTGSQMLVQAATEAVKQWVYQPTLLNGEPVEVQTQIDINFNLNK